MIELYAQILSGIAVQYTAFEAFITFMYLDKCENHITPSIIRKRIHATVCVINNIRHWARKTWKLVRFRCAIQGVFVRNSSVFGQFWTGLEMNIEEKNVSRLNVEFMFIVNAMQCKHVWKSFFFSLLRHSILMGPKLVSKSITFAKSDWFLPFSSASLFSSLSNLIVALIVLSHSFYSHSLILAHQIECNDNFF